jgi:HAD superfamily hydrolase (TIGR01509 family)
MIKAILFDLDGVLVNACEWHFISLNLALKEISNFEINREDHETIFNGLPTQTKLDLLVKENKITADKVKKIWDFKQKYTTKIISENSTIDLTKIELHEYLKHNQINIGCVTNSIKETAALMLEKTGQFSFVELLISNDQIRYPKPSSEGYIKAMIHFNSMPENTIIVEDSPIGMQAAKATGAHIWAVSGSHDVTLPNMLLFLNQLENND